MPRRFIAHICFISLLLAATVPVQAEQPKSDSDSAISQTLQANYYGIGNTFSCP